MKYKISRTYYTIIDLDNPTIDFEDYCGDCFEKTPAQLTKKDLLELLQDFSIHDFYDIFGKELSFEDEVEKI